MENIENRIVAKIKNADEEMCFYRQILQRSEKRNR
jgi:hypothetical protein